MGLYFVLGAVVVLIGVLIGAGLVRSALSENTNTNKKDI